MAGSYEVRCRSQLYSNNYKSVYFPRAATRVTMRVSLPDAKPREAVSVFAIKDGAVRGDSRT